MISNLHSQLNSFRVYTAILCVCICVGAGGGCSESRLWKPRFAPPPRIPAAGDNQEASGVTLR